jgi:hypothetical protein
MLESVVSPLLTAAVLQLSSPNSPARQADEARTEAARAEDLAFIRRELPAHHGDPWHHVTRQRFEAEIDALAGRAAQLSAHAFALELARIVALIGDGHTELQLFGEGSAFQRLPLVLYRFGDELRVIAATAENRDLLGAAVTHLGSFEAADALTRIEPYLARDNPTEFLHQAPTTLASPQVLHALGASEDADRVELTFALDGAEVRREFAGLEAPTAFTPLNAVRRAPRPFTALRPGETCGFSLDTEHGLGFFRLDASSDQAGRPTLAATVEEFFRAVDEAEIARVVIDVRMNSGGSNERNAPLVEAVFRRQRLTERGGLFVLVGRRTFSAGVALVAELVRVAQPILVGEPSRGDPRITVNREQLRLPRSGYWLDYSERYERSEYPDPELRIEIAAPPTFADFERGVDSAWEAVLAFED